MPFLLSPLVGSHFHPPAKVLLQHLPAGTELYLEPEPSNEFDPNALMVILPKHELEKLGFEFFESEEFETALLSSGWSVDSLQTLESLHLGYIAASERTALGYSLNTAFLSVLSGISDWSASLTFTPEGKPLVKLSY